MEFIDLLIMDLLQQTKIDKIDNTIELANIHYMANIGSESKKGFNLYKNFITRMESQKYLEIKQQEQSTVWDRIERYEKKKSLQVVK